MGLSGIIPSVRFGEISDVVEYGRGQLAGLGYVSPNRTREIHVLRLRNAFDRAGIGSSLRYVLRVLDLMREVQQLKDGYWMPTPPRLVPLEDTGILIAPSPTSELKRHFAAVERAGYARVVSHIREIDLPRQTINEWAGLETVDTKSWACEVVRNASKEMSPTVEPQNVEYFSVHRISGHSVPHWSAGARAAATPDGKIVFCRTRLTENYYRYFWASAKKGKVALESPPPTEIDRLQYGIAALIGCPITVLLGANGDGVLLRLFAPVPRPERRLLLGLAVRSGRGKTYQFGSTEHAHLIVTSLQRLGCEIQKTNVG
jgi:hypothetical protein